VNLPKCTVFKSRSLAVVVGIFFRGQDYSVASMMVFCSVQSCSRCACTCTRARARVCVDMSMCACAHIYIYIYTHIYIYIYIYMCHEDILLYRSKMREPMCGSRVCMRIDFSDRSALLTCAWELGVVHLTNIQIWHTNSEECITSRQCDPVWLSLVKSSARDYK
jgi:hypothetical protein